MGVSRSGKQKLWCDEALTRDELAVHPKKVQEVEEWLIKAFTGVKGYRVLLLTGPAGAGKTACLRALVAEMGLNIKEWINATSTACYAPDKLEWSSGGDAWVPGDSVPEQGQVAQFREFATRANKYGSVAVETSSVVQTGAGSVMLVEDLPNAFYRDPAQFHDVLRRYSVSGSSPAVFVLSDSPQLEHSAKNLFPPHLCESISITTIQFNPVAPGLLSKALTRQCTKQRLSVSQDLVISLATAAAGDIRTAVNALQFCSARPDVDPSDVLCFSSTRKGRGGGRAKGRPKGGGKQKAGQAGAPPEESLPSVGGRDASLLMFRALGKVLYCKRSDEPAPPLPPHLRREERAPALECPEAVLDRCCLTPSTFVAFLHQNYHTFMPSVEAASTALQYLADTDIILGRWEDRDALSCYSTIGVRGMMHCTDSSSPSSSSIKRAPSFRPLTAPAFTEVFRTATRRREELRTHYRDQGMHDLTTLFVPFAAKVLRNQYSPASALLQEVGTFGASESSPIKGRRRPPLPVPVAAAEQDAEPLDYDDHIEEVDD